MKHSKRTDETSDLKRKDALVGGEMDGTIEGAESGELGGLCVNGRKEGAGCGKGRGVLQVKLGSVEGADAGGEEHADGVGLVKALGDGGMGGVGEQSGGAEGVEAGDDGHHLACRARTVSKFDNMRQTKRASNLHVDDKLGEGCEVGGMVLCHMLHSDNDGATIDNTVESVLEGGKATDVQEQRLGDIGDANGGCVCDKGKHGGRMHLDEVSFVVLRGLQPQFGLARGEGAVGDLLLF